MLLFETIHYSNCWDTITLIFLGPGPFSAGNNQYCMQQVQQYKIFDGLSLAPFEVMEVII